MTQGTRADAWFTRRHDLTEVFWHYTQVGEPDACWPWVGAVNTQGYGRVMKNRTRYVAHHLSLAIHGIEIPDGLVTDHLCHTRDETCRAGDQCLHRRCVNPRHLELVTDATNTMRGRSPVADGARKTHCPAGHELAGTNLADSKTGFRICLVCKRERIKPVNAAVKVAYHLRREQGHGWREARRLANADVRAARAELALTGG